MTLPGYPRATTCFLLVSLGLACGGGAPPDPGGGGTTPTTSAPMRPHPSAPSGAAAQVAAPAAAWAPPKLPSCHAGALLTSYDYVDVQKRYCELCKDQDDRACTLDWPSSDMPTCHSYDELRNTIYAWYGYPFTSAEWKAHFAKEPWYTADPTFTDTRMSAAARRNIALLKSKAEQKRDCMDP